MIRTLSLLVLLTFISCTTPLELGERRYREGDRVAALEIWRSVDSDSLYYGAVQRRIKEVEDESARLVALFKKRGSYYERKGRLAESVLNYRLALQLRPQDRATLDHVQVLVRALAARVEETRNLYADAYADKDLIGARTHLAALRTLDPFDPRLATDERQLEDRLHYEVTPLLEKGRRAFLAGDYAEAEEAFRGVLAYDAENQEARGRLYYIARIRDEENAAAETGEDDFDPFEITEQQNQARGSLENALNAEADGKLYEAVAYDMMALQENPELQEARDHLSRLRGKLPSAEELIRNGQDYYQQEDLEAALEQWRNALLVDPNNAQALEYVARAERLLENLERLRAEPGGGAEKE